MRGGEMRKQAISIRATEYTDWVPYIGKQRGCAFPSEWYSLQWLSNLLATGEYRISKASILTMQDVEAHRARIEGMK